MIDREALKAKYGSEQVLAVPLEVVKALGLNKDGFQSFESNNTIVLEELMSHAVFIPRYDSDFNPQMVEICTYVTFFDENNIFAYKRVKNGDVRGDGKYSLGVGGHINPDPSEKITILDASFAVDEAYREIKEELGAQEYVENSISFDGFIRCLGSDFDLDHIGLSFSAERAVYSVQEYDSMLPLGMIHVDALMNEFYPRLENWSQILLDYYTTEMD